MLEFRIGIHVTVKFWELLLVRGIDSFYCTHDCAAIIVGFIYLVFFLCFLTVLYFENKLLN